MTAKDAHDEDPIVVRARELAREDGAEWCLYHSLNDEKEEEGDEVFAEYMERARRGMETPYAQPNGCTAPTTKPA